MALPYDVNLKAMFWIVTMVYLGFIGSFFVIKSVKTKENKPLSEMFRALAILFYMYIFTRLFYILSDYERDANNLSLQYYRYLAMAYICTILALLSIIFVLEKYVIVRVKHSITYIVLIILGVNVIMIFFPALMAIVRYLNYALLYSELAVIIIIYIYLVINTTGDVRKKSMLTLIALIVMILATILELDILLTTGITQPYYSPIIFAIGVTIFAYAQRK